MLLGCCTEDDTALTLQQEVHNSWESKSRRGSSAYEGEMGMALALGL